MNQQEASLIVRLAAVAASEGQGPEDPQPGDDDLTEEAIRVSGVDPYSLWWSAASQQRMGRR